MKRLVGPLLALAGFALAFLLFWQQDLGEVAALLRTGGAGLVLAALAHIPSMALNAQAWRLLLPRRARPSLPAMTAVVWIRESVNGLLPVARLGGEVASYRLLRAEGASAAQAVASLMLDVALSMLSQLAFALLGLALLAAAGTALGWGGLLLAMGGGLALAAGFVLAQRADLLSRVAAALNRAAAGRFGALLSHSARIDRATRRLWRARRAVLLCFLWQLAGWMAGALEIWIAAQAIGAPVSVGEALAIEAMVQAVASAAFLMPGALGLQEAGFLGVGMLLGLPAEAAAALALARRLRDLLVFLPGLLFWVRAERRIALASSAPAAVTSR
jgi:glycosyltransferase 2 family protein